MTMVMDTGRTEELSRNPYGTICDQSTTQTYFIGPL